MPLDPKRVPHHQLDMRFGRFMSRMRTAEWREGIAEVDELTKLATSDKIHYYRFAYAYSIAAGLQTDDKEKEAYARRSVEFLRQAREHGFQDAADVERLKQDPEFNRLRDREDFKKLMQELEKSAVGYIRPTRP